MTSSLPLGGCGGEGLRISPPRHDVLGEEKWLISQRRRARLLLGLICIGIQGIYVKLINHCQAEMIKQ